ncbi:alanine racemase [Desulfocucumis palustris]|uniref:Alanine racemase n=1 Tax=Desulfocucumis palustris TaxID=1898651 RepID=A0A2L2XHI4_9FIRM|nr:serine racemase VanT catalytic subunit [Desulfocucumis palustris]GBF33696.1 alanine racemase [Desulfocucumis palustris]
MRTLTLHSNNLDRAWAEIHLANLGHNVKVLRNLLPHGCELMAVVKANAYGHGDVKIARYLNRIGVFSFAVATIEEGIRLRTYGIKGNILILGYTDPHRLPELVRYRLSQTVVDYKHAKQLNASEQPISVHIKIDTGMHRLGESCNNTAEIESIFQCRNLRVCGIYTHLYVADSTQEDDIAFTKEQLSDFYTLLEHLKQHRIKLPKMHIQSSYGILNYPELQCSYARIGIALYGVLSSPSNRTKIQPELRPVLSLKSRVVLIRQIVAGECVGYGRAFSASRNTRIAVLSIGYADGVPRSLSCGKGEVLIHGCRAPIIGRICMDQLMIDITDIHNVKRGDIATLLGEGGSEVITAEEVAAASETIANELLSRLGSRLERVYL